MPILLQTQDFSMFEFRDYFRWRMPTSIYIVSDQKLTTRCRGSRIADNIGTCKHTHPGKDSKHSVCTVWLKVEGLFKISQTFKCLALHLHRHYTDSHKGYRYTHRWPSTQPNRIAHNLAAHHRAAHNLAVSLWYRLVKFNTRHAGHCKVVF